MSNVITYQRFWQRRDTAINWATANPVLAAGEFGVEIDDADVTVLRLKLGDGVTAWDALPYLPVDRNTTTALTSSAGVLTVNYALGDYFTLALSENVTSWSISNPPGAGKAATLMLRVTQDATPRTVAWPVGWKWEGGTPGAVSSIAGTVDLLAITTFDNFVTAHVSLALGWS